MIGLLRLWYKSKKLKYDTYLMTYEELTDKFVANMDSLTLPELVQFHYMSKETIGLQALADRFAAAVAKNEEPVDEPSTIAGQYL